MGRLTVIHNDEAPPVPSEPDDRGRHPGGEPPPVLLIVEDDGSTLNLLQDVALDAGWEARGFTSLADFRAALERGTPDMIILDDDLPDGRGGDLARELRGDRRLRDVPVVVCTAAHPMRVAEINAWAPVVQKPFDLPQIERFLDAAVGRRSEGGAQAAG